MLKAAEQNGREYWFVLDELFRGTTPGTGCRWQRGIGHLTGRGIVIASTHDHKLAHLLRNEFDLYTFPK